VPVRPIASHVCLALLAALLCSARQDPAAPAATQPANEAVRILSSVAVEGGRTAADVLNANVLQSNPVYRGWAAWPVGTRVVIREDEIDAQGRRAIRGRTVERMTSLMRDSARIVYQSVGQDGALGDPVEVTIFHQDIRLNFLLKRRTASMVYWRRFDARVAFDIGPTAASREPPGRRALEPPPRDPGEPIPAEFDCAIIEIAVLDTEEDPAKSGEPADARPGDAIHLYRSYHSVEAPGWEVMLEVFSGQLDGNGLPTGLELLSRRRIERILRPGEADPTLQQLREGIRLQ
jgi:hypothetical protein